jgi:preprotein translocase subunit SecA
MIEDVIDNAIAKYMAGEEADSWDFDGLRDNFLGIFLTKEDLKYDVQQLNNIDKEKVKALLLEKAMAAYARSEEENTPEKMREIERVVMLRTVDIHWMDHIDAMDDLRQGVSLRAYSNWIP